MQSSDRTTPEVLVVGAGPTGLALANELARLGVRFRIIEKATAPSALSKALGVQARTLEYFERLGIADRAIAAGRKLHGLSVSSEGKRIVHVSLDPIPSRFNFALIYPQSGTEQLLTEHLTGLGAAVERDTELVSLAQDQDGVAVVLRQPERGGEERLRVPWLVGCDGAHSAVRHALDIPFIGKAFDENFSLADIRLDGNVPDDEVSVFLSHGNIIALFPMPGDRRFRIAMEQPTPPSPGSEPSLEEFQQVLDTWGPPGTRLSDPTWLARFRISQRQVERYREGRVFLAGDAAHIHSPLGGQGMNTGIQDACNLAWKLALVCSGRGRPELLDSYQQERHPVGKALLRGTGTLTNIVMWRNPIAEAVRDRVASFLTSFDFMQDRIRGGLAELGIHYRHSPIVAEDRESGGMGLVAGWLHAETGPRAGDRAPDAAVRRTADGTAVRLFELMPGTRHTLLLFAGRRTSVEDVVRRRTILDEVARGRGDLINPYLIIPGLGQAADSGSAEMLLDPDGSAHRAYGADDEMLYLVRPDSYVGYRSQPAVGTKLREYLGRILV